MAISPPHVSVVLPTYNRAHSLSDSIDSVLNQTYGDFELIIVDDASTDDTEAVVKRFDDSRIRYFEHESNQGVSAARNTGIAESRGNIVAFQDSDDEWLPQKLQKQIDGFRNASREVGVVYTGMHRVVDGKKRYVPYPAVEQKEGNIQQSIVEQNFISTQMAAVRRECFDEIGLFDEELSAFVDWELWLRVSEKYRFRLVDEPLVRATVNPDSLSRNRYKKVSARARIVEKHSDRFDRETLGNHLFHVGNGAMRLGRTKEGIQYLMKAVWTTPNPLYLMALLCSLFGSRVFTIVSTQFKSMKQRSTVSNRLS